MAGERHGRLLSEATLLDSVKPGKFVAPLRRSGLDALTIETEPPPATMRVLHRRLGRCRINVCDFNPIEHTRLEDGTG
jgi:hypothetical protein